MKRTAHQVLLFKALVSYLFPNILVSTALKSLIYFWDLKRYVLSLTSLFKNAFDELEEPQILAPELRPIFDDDLVAYKWFFGE